MFRAWVCGLTHDTYELRRRNGQPVFCHYDMSKQSYRMKNGFLWDVTACGSCDELSASIIRVTRIGELGTMLAVTSNRYMLQRNTKRVVSVANSG
jgi:hypothetical protein